MATSGTVGTFLGVGNLAISFCIYRNLDKRLEDVETCTRCKKLEREIAELRDRTSNLEILVKNLITEINPSLANSGKSEPTDKNVTVNKSEKNNVDEKSKEIMNMFNKYTHVISGLMSNVSSTINIHEDSQIFSTLNKSSPEQVFKVEEISDEDDVEEILKSINVKKSGNIEISPAKEIEDVTFPVIEVSSKISDIDN